MLQSNRGSFRQFVVPCAVLVAAIAWSSGRVTAQIPVKFTNLQVLPKDIAQRPLIDMMRSFTFALGVRCEFCHVGEGNDLSKFDFASDEKPTKGTARQMLKLVASIAPQVANVGEPATTPKVTCFTCHRGDRKPQTAPPGRGGGPGHTGGQSVTGLPLLADLTPAR